MSVAVELPWATFVCSEICGIWSHIVLWGQSLEYGFQAPGLISKPSLAKLKLRGSTACWYAYGS